MRSVYAIWLEVKAEVSIELRVSLLQTVNGVGGRVSLFTVVRIFVCLSFLAIGLFVWADTFDDDTILEFYWEPASGNVHHYNVYLSVGGGDYFFVGTTQEAPTQESLYVVPIVAEYGRSYQIKVEAEAADGTTGPMSEPSDPVWCIADFIPGTPVNTGREG